MISALIISIMMLAYLPNLTYAVSAFAALFVAVVMIELSPKWATLVFVITAIVSFFTAENEAKVVYCLFFGYYPILKGIIERYINNKVLEWFIKVVLLNLAAAIVSLVLVFFFGFGIEGLFGTLKYAILIAAVGVNLVFIVYDICVTRLVSMYLRRLHPRVKRFLKK